MCDSQIFGSNYHPHMVAQPRFTPFVQSSLSHTMDATHGLPGATAGGNPNPALQTQQPVIGGVPAGQVYALPHPAWQHRPYGQFHHLGAYAAQDTLPPPLPAGQPEQGVRLEHPPGMQTQAQPRVLGPAFSSGAQHFQLSPGGGEHVPVPQSVASESAAQGYDDLEAAAGPASPDRPGPQTPSATQQQGIDVAILTASIQSMSTTLQHLMAENKRLNDQMMVIMTKGAEKGGPGQAGSSGAGEQGESGGGAGEVRRPLIGSFDRESPVPTTEDQQDLKDIDKKDVALPSKYKGDTVTWRHWYMKFSSFLNRRDPRWSSLLEEIKKKSQNPLGPQEEEEIFTNIGVKSSVLRDKFKFQLYEYLETYSEGLVHGMVTAGGIQGSLEVFRGLCDDGFSMRDRHLRREYRKVTHPKQASFETLKKAIMDWETELAQYQSASGTEMSEKEKIICLEDLCPDLLQQHLDSKESLQTYGQYKIAINDYLSNRSRWMAGKGRLNWLGFPEADPEEPAPDETGEEWFSEQLKNISGEINALVKNKFKGKSFGKGGKGGGATKGGNQPQGGGSADVDMPDAKKDNSGKKCYECNEVGHIANDCPVRKARVAAGGPERVKKGGKGQQGGGKGGWPTKSQWGGFYPGPTQAQWNQWFPNQPRAGVAALQDQSGQAQTVLQSLFAGPQQLSLKSITTMAKPPVQIRNRFDALETPKENEEGTKNSQTVITASIEDFIKPARRNIKRTKRLCVPRGCCSGPCSGEHTAHPVVEEPQPQQAPAVAVDQSTGHVLATSATDSLTEKSTAVDEDRAARDRRRQEKYAEFMQGKDDIKLDVAGDTNPDRQGGKLPVRVEKSSDPYESEYDNFMKSIGCNQDKQNADNSLKTSLQDFLNFANSKYSDLKAPPKQQQDPGKINLLNKVVRTGNLMPVTKREEVNTKAGTFEVLSCIVDSGATVPVMNPTTGVAYPMQESDASREGVLYKLANDDTLPNLGEKKMAVLTSEGTLRGYGSQCANVSEPLQAVRSLVRSKHAVCFGLGENDDEHLIINKQTGEINRMRDDGINYLQDLLIIPPDRVDEVAAELHLLQQQGDQGGQGFGRPGP